MSEHPIGPEYIGAQMAWCKFCGSQVADKGRYMYHLFGRTMCASCKSGFEGDIRLAEDVVARDWQAILKSREES